MKLVFRATLKGKRKLKNRASSKERADFADRLGSYSAPVPNRIKAEVLVLKASGDLAPTYLW